MKASLGLIFNPGKTVGIPIISFRDQMEGQFL